MTYAQKLRKLARWLDKHPKYAEHLNGRYDYPDIVVWANDKDEFSRLCRTLGTFDKAGYNGTISAQKKVETDEHVEFSARVYLSGACERTPKLDETGRQIVTTVPAREVPEYEWKCPDSWLDMK